MRCLSLARYFDPRSVKIKFICKELPHNLIPVIEKEFPVVRVKSNFNSEAFIDDDYSTWNCSDDREEAETILQELEPMGENLIVLDHYGIGEEAESFIREETKLLVFDDVFRKHNCDYLLDQNYGSSIKDYSSSKIGQGFFGNQYAVIDKKFINVKNALSESSQAPEALVYFGGVDKTNELPKVVAALNKLEPFGFKTKIIIRENADNYQEIKGLVDGNPEIELIPPSSDFPNILMKMKFMIGASGSTNWERCFLGVPGVIVSIADNQVSIAKRFSESKAVEYLGDGNTTTAKDWENVLSAIKNKTIDLSTMAKKATEIIDGLGGQRIVEELMKGVGH